MRTLPTWLPFFTIVVMVSTFSCRPTSLEQCVEDADCVGAGVCLNGFCSVPRQASLDGGPANGDTDNSGDLSDSGFMGSDLPPTEGDAMAGDTGMDVAVDTGVDAPVDMGEPPPTFAMIADVLTGNCAGGMCHGMDGGRGGLEFTADIADADLAMVLMGNNDNGDPFVTANAPDNSRIYVRMSDADNPMPPGGQRPADEIMMVLDWINAGANFDDN